MTCGRVLQICAELILEKAVGMPSAAYHGALHLGSDADFLRLLPELGRTPIAPHDTAPKAIHATGDFPVFRIRLKMGKTNSSTPVQVLFLG
jgi:hypothetical protein